MTTASADVLTVLIADKFEADGVKAMESLGFDVRVQPDLTPETLPAAITAVNPTVLVVRSTQVPAGAITAGGRLSLIVRAGAGYDNIDVEAASSQGVFVANCPGKNGLAVAEMAWGLILACDRRIPDQTIDLRAGKWAKKEYAKARGLYGRTLGVIGLGVIGKAVAERGLAFGMNVVAWSRSLTPEAAEDAGYDFAASPIDVAKTVDVVSLHVAATSDTKHLVNAGFLDAMKPGAILINTSRGSVVDEAALIAAVREKGIRCGLDVWDNQPAPTDTAFGNAIVGEPGVYGSHHCGASTDQAQQAIADETVRVIKVYAASGDVPNCVNRAATSPATCLLTVRHLNRPGVLSHIFRLVSEAGINVEEMENIIYEGAQAACARIQLDDKPTDDLQAAINTNTNVLSVEVVEKRKG